MFVYRKKSASGQTGTWWADFEAEGFRRQSLNLPDTAPKARAVSEMGRVYRRLSSSTAQMALPVVELAEGVHSFAAAIDLWQPLHEANTVGGEQYVKSYAKLVRRELGNVLLSDLAGRNGSLRLQRYRDDLANIGLSIKTRNNRLNTVAQVLRFAVEHGLLPGLPNMPKARTRGERPAPIVYDYIDEVTFRALRDAIFSKPQTASMLATSLFPKAKFPKMPDDEKASRVQAYIASRRLYLSLGFYTGMRTRDLDETIGADLSVDFGRYLRRGSKTGAKEKWLEAPEQLALDIKEAQAALGPYWKAKASVTGGTWKKVGNVMADAARLLSLSTAPTPRVLRRSFVRQLALRGWELHRVKEFMGHSADSAMLETVYKDCPEAPARCFAGSLGGVEWTVQSTRLLEGSRKHDGARVLSFDSVQPVRRGSGLFGG